MISATTVAQSPTHSQVRPAERALLADQLQRLRVRLEGRALAAKLTGNPELFDQSCREALRDF